MKAVSPICFKKRKLLLLFGCVFLFLSQVLSQSEPGREFINRKEPYNLCEASRKGVDAANLLSKDSLFSFAKISIQQAGKDKHEHSITLGRDANRNLSLSPIINGDSSNGRVTSNWPGAFADIHNHSNDHPPSAGDLHYLIKLNSKNQFYDTRFVVTKSGSVYALHIYDLKLASDFVAKYPLEQTAGFSPRFPEPVFDDIDTISAYFEGHGIDRLISRERALAFVLAKYNAGVVLLKQHNSGSFQTLQTEEKISGRVKNYIAGECK